MAALLEGEGGWSVSFAGCGFLGVYHIGAAACLQERAPRLLRDARRVYGASAGALAGAAIVGGGSLVESSLEVFHLAKEARKHNLGPFHPSFNIMKIIKEGLNKTLPENTHELLSGKFYISLTRVSDGKNVLISHFNSKEEVVQALLCSSFIPIYCGLIPPSFRGVRYVDGGLTDNLPQNFSKDTITISPFSAECDICPRDRIATLGDMTVTNIKANLNLWNFYRFHQAVFPPEPKVLFAHLVHYPIVLSMDIDSYLPENDLRAPPLRCHCLTILKNGYIYYQNNSCGFRSIDNYSLAKVGTDFAHS